ncbi:5-amino-6-(5-phospho-D-ribitylamino)uracil phosphatase YigB [Vibrio hippocampi]|uniref:5-amino-6-(5-phospho-D-ribitylamino)uracil phosphatase YigB n=1 Tax=Vibrio hippocampi TaxID=654686 RepID=A0ABM8ZKK9_9VIBR|nr:5-amino-6-(5-phospho-D-ribitylamino)uracil phosphatase YigB [Vibrio hippocampi]CAH0527381.1 5-amino-6-(5-phospho-D-ribitylamino)uracil phosphatase YigB [Vibrio hippocampi]
MRFYRNIPTVQAMTFDLDDTLYDNRPVIQRVETLAAEWLFSQHPISQNWTKQQWQDCKQQVLKQDDTLKHDVTRWRFQQLRQGLGHLGYDDPKAQSVAQQLIDMVLTWRNEFDVPCETHDVLSQLSRNMPLVAITNGNVNVEKIGLSHYFSLILKAGPDGRAKPEADMFDKAVEFLDLPKQRILHVGDHCVTDVGGAKRHGLLACWFNDRGVTPLESSRLKVLPDIEISSLSSLLTLLP